MKDSHTDKGRRKSRLARLALGLCIVGSMVAFTACAPQAKVPDPAADNPPAADNQASSESASDLPWSPEVDCSVCHSAESDSAESLDCLAQTHTAAGTLCADCHNDQEALATVHEKDAGKTPPAKLRTTKVTTKTCLSCHEHDSMEAIAARAGDISIADDKGTAANPHQLPSNPDHDSLTCTECHVSHRETDTLEEARGTCLSCHHAGVFECGTCHE